VNDLIETETFKKNGASLNKLPLPGCDHLKYGTDDYWTCYIRHLSGTVYHPCCTCKMGPFADPEAVVDDELR
jgi:choline dehydrogenase-like flavoprotein